MSPKNILVSYNGTPEADSALNHALKMAKYFDAHLTGVLSYGPQELVTSYAGYMPAGVAEQLVEADLARRDEIKAKFESMTADYPPAQVHFRDVFGSADEGLMEVSRCYDLIIMGRADKAGPQPHMEPHPDIVCRHSGRPVLVIPKDYRVESFSNTAIIAWDGGRAASRALSDSMGIMKPEATVTVLTIGDPDQGGALDSIASHLARHGMKVKRDIREKSAKGVADTILTAAKDSGVGLLVMGAYEHSKFAEDLFGGVTNTVLRNAEIPVLMSH